MRIVEPIRILIIDYSPRMPLTFLSYRKKFEYLSTYFLGTIITPVHGDIHLEVKKIGKFMYHPFLYSRGSSILRNLRYFFKILYKAMYLYYHKKEKYKVVISPNPLFTGLTALFIGRLTHSRVIIEVNGNFESAFKYGGSGDGDVRSVERLKDKASRVIINFVLERADRIKLLYSDQLKKMNLKSEKKMEFTAFSNFVYIKEFLSTEKEDGKYILSLGHPWYLKGMDVLIKAFNLLSKDFPDYKLKIVGHCPQGRDYYEKLAKNNSQIEFHKPVHYEGVLDLMTKCSIFALASRTEAMGRVLLEAMASEKPIVASCVDGIPMVIKDGYNGLLFENENYHELSHKMIKLLKNPNLAIKLARNAHNYVQNELSEETYASNYHEMILDVLTSRSGKTAIQYQTPVL